MGLLENEKELISGIMKQTGLYKEKR